jgi:NDP-sugar pyrophosphorylase family protein
LWFDIGRREDYEQAVAAWIEAANGKDSRTNNEVARGRV